MGWKVSVGASGSEVQLQLAVPGVGNEGDAGLSSQRAAARGTAGPSLHWLEEGDKGWAEGETSCSGALRRTGTPCLDGLFSSLCHLRWALKAGAFGACHR